MLFFDLNADPFVILILNFSCAVILFALRA